MAFALACACNTFVVKIRNLTHKQIPEDGAECAVTQPRLYRDVENEIPVESQNTANEGITDDCP